jgi:hypothetical protein
MTLTAVDCGVRDSDGGEAERLKVGKPVTVRVMLVVLMRLPEVPVTVMVVVPVAADALAVKVNALVPAMEPRAKMPVTPAGRAEADNTIVPVKPFRGAAVMVLFAEFPCARPMVAGDAERVKPETDVTVRLIAKVPTMLPDLPVMVIVELPATAEPAADKVSVLDPAGEPGELKDAVIPVGNPETLMATLPEKPF